MRDFFEQGVEGIVPYAGRLKPGVEDWEKILIDTLFDSGARNLEEFRKYAHVERLSIAAQREAGATIEVVK